MPSFRPCHQVLLNAGAGEDDDTDRQHVEHLIAALERCRLGVFGPIGLEGDLRNLRWSAQREAIRSAPFGNRRAAAPYPDAWRGPDRACPRSGDDRCSRGRR
jgi:hypothetical protein